MSSQDIQRVVPHWGVTRLIPKLLLARERLIILWPAAGWLVIDCGCLMCLLGHYSWWCFLWPCGCIEHLQLKLTTPDIILVQRFSVTIQEWGRKFAFNAWNIRRPLKEQNCSIKRASNQDSWHEQNTGGSRIYAWAHSSLKRWLSCLSSHLVKCANSYQHCQTELVTTMGRRRTYLIDARFCLHTATGFDAV